jgi:hypothetical protein
VSTDIEARLPLARATLVALYAMTGAAVDFAHAAPIWLPEIEQLTVDEAIRRLAAMRPAIRCAPFSTGRDIAIGAWEARPLNEFRDEVLDLLLRDIAVWAPQYTQDDYEVTVRGEAEGDVASLSWPQYEQWTREFELVAPTLRMSGSGSPTGEHPPRFVVTISPPSAEGPVSGTYA